MGSLPALTVFVKSPYAAPAGESTEMDHSKGREGAKILAIFFLSLPGHRSTLRGKKIYSRRNGRGHEQYP
jgi:hypothetical protein